MKKSYLMAIGAFLLIPFVSNAQNKLDPNGNVGIGTQSPIGVLDVRGNFFVGTTDLSIGNAGSFLQIDQGAGTGNSYTQLRAFSHGGTRTNNLILQNSGGNVGIGTSTPDALLAVKGNVHCQGVKVDMDSWSDDVFKPKYVLPSLSSVKAYISENQHLPEVPSEQEVLKNGINLGEMNKLLLKKVEELTLYLIREHEDKIAQQKEIDDLKQQVRMLSKK